MKQLRESFSALMDDEGDEFDLRRVFKQMETASGEADTWRRYHLARSMMQREREAVVDIDISADVMAAIADEPAPGVAEAPTASRRHSFSFMGGAAVAAAVSLMVITGVQVYNGFGGDAAVPADIASSGESLTPAAGAQPAFALPSGGGESGVIPASMRAPASSGMPIFSMAGAGTGGGEQRGLMTIGDDVMLPLFSASGDAGLDQEQGASLQSYLARRTLGNGDLGLLHGSGNYASQLHAIDASATR
ncbi:sigma-E factor negative regulatory protein [Salinicola sp. DM10]|uniref:sigma-E factor negative regulatory protein n=1 Tax=Salinicola sp. DM10 TaxID=2815721 RepID=UPI001A8D4502|nr:sigma-E factor negative regulatory protein [Salinicola sp. DM10]MCE3025497.1 sigma-E factor negative regulatory protein [Salinicola sp. DM10]